MFQRFTGFLVRLVRWRIEGEIPPYPKMVVVAASHTSNWDFPLAMIVAPALGLRITWLGKHTLFRKPFGWFFRLLGGIPVDRRNAHGLTETTVEAFESADRLQLVIAPEGTRSKREYWKSGFYRIAMAAQVPIVFVGVDGDARTIRVGPDFIPQGTVKADMDIAREFFAEYGGIKPHLAGIPRLRNEDDIAGSQ